MNVYLIDIDNDAYTDSSNF